MKKILIILAILFINVYICIGQNGRFEYSYSDASSDGFFEQSYTSLRENIVDVDDLMLPSIPYHTMTTDQDAPVGSGLFVLSALGVGYLAMRRRKEK